MSRPVSLYPGSDVNVFMCAPWLGGIYPDDSSREMWIDFHFFLRTGTSADHRAKQPIDFGLLDQIDRVVVFDFLHGEASLESWEIDWVRDLAAHRPLVWITTNTKSIPGVRTVKFDYYWNRTKTAYLDQRPFHKQCGRDNFQQYPIHTNPRSHKFLSYHLRNADYREILQQHLNSRPQGFISSATNWLEPNTETPRSAVAPPARQYFDQSYISCLVETQCMKANSILISEKTYDQLIQGRPVLNFATPHFYQQLVADGWQLPMGVDWSWDSVIDDRQRMTAYLVELDKLLLADMQDLHQWFVDNMPCWQHNHSMLRSKPYDIIDTSGFW